MSKHQTTALSVLIRDIRESSDYLCEVVVVQYVAHALFFEAASRYDKDELL